MELGIQVSLSSTSQLMFSMHILQRKLPGLYIMVLKVLVCFFQLYFFPLVCKFYRYRERDEIVNEQANIEEQYERELLLNT